MPVPTRSARRRGRARPTRRTGRTCARTCAAAAGRLRAAHGVSRDAGMCVCSDAQQPAVPALLDEPRELGRPEAVVGGEVGDASVHQSQPRLRNHRIIPTSTTTITPMTIQNAAIEPSPGTRDVHPEDRRDQRQRQHDHAERRQHAQDVVEAVREDRLVGRLEPLDDLLEVLEHVPDALGRVVDVVEVDVELAGHVALGALEVAQRGALRADDLAEVDDLLLGVGEVADDLRVGAPSKMSSSRRSSLLPILRSIGNEASTHVVDDLVEQVAGALGEQLLAQRPRWCGSARRGTRAAASGSLGSVMRKSGPTKMSTSAAFRRPTRLS